MTNKKIDKPVKRKVVKLAEHKEKKLREQAIKRILNAADKLNW